MKTIGKLQFLLFQIEWHDEGDWAATAAAFPPQHHLTTSPTPLATPSSASPLPTKYSSSASKRPPGSPTKSVGGGKEDEHKEVEDDKPDSGCYMDELTAQLDRLGQYIQRRELEEAAAAGGGDEVAPASAHNYTSESEMEEHLQVRFKFHENTGLSRNSGSTIIRIMWHTLQPTSSQFLS